MPRRPLLPTAPIAVVLALLITACSGEDNAPQSAPTTRTSSSAQPTTTPSTPTATPTATPTVEPGPVAPTEFADIATGFDVPWGLAFLPDGSALLSERDTARILLVSPRGRVSEVGTVADVAPRGEGGLLGIAFAPDSTETVYAYFTSAEDNRVVRMPYRDGGLGDAEVIIDGIPKAGNHNGGRITFGPDGMLYVGTGDASDSDLSQDLESLGGKILRLNPDGSIPADNPFDGSPVYSYGHRNVQGLAFDDDGNLWASEFGQATWDELNLIRAGENYGWPVVEGIGNDDRFVDPVAQWSTDEASPSGLAYIRDTLFMAALRGERLWQIPVRDGVAGSPADFAVDEFGRLRHAEPAPDGTLWVLTNNTARGDPREGDDRILRVTLQTQG
jgi:glucose/arabinose dehydrogenase